MCQNTFRGDSTPPLSASQAIRVFKEQTLIVCHATEPRATDYNCRTSSQNTIVNINIRFDTNTQRRCCNIVAP